MTKSSNKFIIWIIGPLSSGKTTQNKLLLKHLGDAPRQYHEGEENGTPYSFTNYGFISSLGLMNESQCCGLDRVSSKLKNAGMQLSLQKALQESSMVVVESIMSASTWFDILNEPDARLFLFNLTLSFEENVQRLKKRKWFASKVGDIVPLNSAEYPLTDANYEFIRKTRMQYKGIYDKFAGQAFSAKDIICDGKEPERINKEIRKHIIEQIS